MNVWLITTGNSDVQVKSASAWCDWYRAMPKGGLHGNDRKSFTPSRPIDDDGEPYRMAARVLGLAYEALGDAVWEELAFPLLEAFRQKLQEQQVAIDEMILLLTDQSSVFGEDDRASPHCPYWQDTSLLYPMLERYLRAEFPGVGITPLVLHPLAGQSGLDHWNEVLLMVQRQLGELAIDPDRVYVSHQAGTPAISSAVQFSSLARFGDRVRFLVSNEYRREPEVLPSSNYLRGIQIEQAKKLIDRHDYAGTQQLLAPYLNLSQSSDRRVEKLLDALIDWNSAEFQSFEEKVLAVEGFAKEEFSWWRLGYESAYLAVVRLHQGNTVDAVFHSFRAVEGLLQQWVKDNHLQKLRQTPHPRGDRNLNSYGQDLYWFLKIERGVDPHKDIDIKVFGEHVFKQRNELFHQLKGLQDKTAVFRAWQSPNEKKWGEKDEEKWKSRVLNCLNFIAAKDLPQPFLSLEAASLMTKAHQELKAAMRLWQRI